MKTSFDIYEIDVLDNFLPFLINGDSTNLKNVEIQQIINFEKEMIEIANRDFKGRLISHHWSTKSRNGKFDKCEISQLFGEISLLLFVCKLKEIES